MQLNAMYEIMTDCLANRSLALVLWGKTKTGEDDVVVFPGTLRQIDGRYYLERKEGSALLELSTEWMLRIKDVSEELREVLCDCELQLSLIVADIEEEDAAGYIRLGLKWPV